MAKQALQYTGTAHNRLIEPQHLAEVGFDYPHTLFFDTQDLRTRGQAIVVDDEVAEWLTSHDTFVRVEGMAVAPLLRSELPDWNSSDDAPAEPVDSDPAEQDDEDDN
jgi:hypothetical protein